MYKLEQNIPLILIIYQIYKIANIVQQVKEEKGFNMLLFSVSFLVMDTSASEVDQDQSCSHSHSPTMMEEAMAKIQPFVNLILTEEETNSDLVDRSMLQKHGIILQILNQSCPGSSSIIGAVRISLQDIRKAPAYLSRHRRLIKQHAVRILMKHHQDMNYGLGAAETLSSDDFGMSFTVASVSANGAAMNPGNRKEGALFCCHFPMLTDPIPLTRPDWDTNTEGVAVHVINAYINLLPLHQRRRYVIEKEREEKAALESAKTSPQTHGQAKKLKTQNSSSSLPAAKSHPNVKPQHPESVALREEIARLKVLTSRLQQQALPSPPLPTTKPPVWPSKNQGPDLPDDL